jgi:hypothetical protein
MEITNNQPLVLVFYIKRDVMTQQSIIQPFVDSVNDLLERKNANIIAFFLPTDGDERIESLNPVQLKETEMEKINKLIEDLSNQFDINQKD